MPALLVRAAAPADAAEIAAIYNEGIADRVATFETRERTVEEVRAWLDDALPFIVATVDDGSWAGRGSPRTPTAASTPASASTASTSRAQPAATASAGGSSTSCASPRRPPASTS